MLRKFCVFLAVSFEDLGLTAFKSASNLFIFFVELEFSFNQEKWLAKMDVLRIGWIEKSLAKRKVVNRVKNIGFTSTVRPCEYSNILREVVCGITVTSEIYQRKALEFH